MPVKPFTLMGEGMLVTVGALMPGGVLPPAAIDKKTDRTCSITMFFTQEIVEKFLLRLISSYDRGAASVTW